MERMRNLEKQVVSAPESIRNTYGNIVQAIKRVRGNFFRVLIGANIFMTAACDDHILEEEESPYMAEIDMSVEEDSYSADLLEIPLTCEEEKHVPWLDSDGDGLDNNLDDHPCCSEPPTTRIDLADKIAGFGVKELGMNCDTNPPFEFPDVETLLSIQCVLKWGVMSGSPDGNFKPDDSINRAEAAKAISELLFLEDNVLPSDWKEKLPSDVQGGDWYAKPVAKLTFSTNLAPDKEIFRPADATTSCLVDGVLGNACELGYCALTRAEGLITIVEALGLSCDIGEPHFTDIPPEHPAYEAVECAVAHNLIYGEIDSNGLPTGTFGPNNVLKRQEVIRLLVDKLNLSGGETSPVFTDVPETLWSYESIMAAVENGLLTPGSEFKPTWFASQQWLDLILARARAQNLLP